MRLKLSGLVLALGLLLGASASADSSKNITYHGITLTPAIKNVEVSPDEPSASFKIKVENRQPYTVNLQATSLDFKSLNDTGGVAFIGSGSAALEHKYGLANWISLPDGQLALPPNSSHDITVTIDNRTDLSPGGHYAAVLLKDAASASGQGNRVSFNQVVATLVFLKKTGGEVYDLQTQKPNLHTAWFGLPHQLDLFIKNTGNTQTAPRGIVSLENANGKQFSRAIVNRDSALVLPESTRLYPVNLFMVARAWLPGTYKAVITTRPDDSSSAKTDEYQFLYINLGGVILILVVLAVLWVGWKRLRQLRIVRKKTD